jgi:hypothetical protein
MRPILTGRARHHQTQNLSDQHPEPVKKRFQEELGYRYADSWPIYAVKAQKTRIEVVPVPVEVEVVVPA